MDRKESLNFNFVILLSMLIIAPFMQCHLYRV